MQFQKCIIILLLNFIFCGASYAQQEISQVDFSADPQYLPFQSNAIKDLKAQVKEATSIMDWAISEVQYSSSDAETVRILLKAQKQALDALYVSHETRQLLNDDCSIEEIIGRAKERANHFTEY